MRADEDDLHQRVEQHRPEEREDEREWNVAAGIFRLAGGDRHVLEAGAGEQRGEPAQLEGLDCGLSRRGRQCQPVPVDEDES